MGGVAAVETPCTGVCRLDVAGEQCLGCGRTLDEIGRWPSMSAAERRAVMTMLAARATARGPVID